MVMLAIIVALSAVIAPPVSQTCRACKIIAGKQVCSNVGIACQPPVPENKIAKGGLKKSDPKAKRR